MNRIKLKTYDIVTADSGVFAIVDAGRWHIEDGRLSKGIGLGVLAYKILDQKQAESVGALSSPDIRWDSDSLDRIARKLLRLRRLLSIDESVVVDPRLEVLMPNLIIGVHPSELPNVVDEHLSRLLGSAFGVDVSVADEHATIDAIALLRAAGEATRIIGLFEEAHHLVSQGEDATDALQQIALSVLEGIEH